MKFLLFIIFSLSFFFYSKLEKLNGTIYMFCDDMLEYIQINEKNITGENEIFELLQNITYNFSAEPGDKVTFGIYNKEKIGGISGVITFRSINYSTEDSTRWKTSDNCEDQIILNRSNQNDMNIYDPTLNKTGRFVNNVLIGCKDTNLSFTIDFYLPIFPRIIKENYETIIPSEGEFTIDISEFFTVQENISSLSGKLFFEFEDSNFAKDFGLPEGQLYPVKNYTYKAPKGKEGYVQISIIGVSISEDKTENKLMLKIGICKKGCVNCKSKYSIELWYKVCTNCIDNYHFFYLSEESIITCIHETEKPKQDYYLDIKDNAYKKCEDSCDKCDDNSKGELIDRINCFNDYPSNDYYLLSNKYTKICHYYIASNGDCVTECPKGEYLFDSKCYLICPPGTQKMVDVCLHTNDIIKALLGMQNGFTKYLSQTLYGEDYTIDINYADENSPIQLGPCEDTLREKYNIPKDEKLIILKVELHRESELTNQFEYEVYSLNNTLLNLSYCENDPIEIKYPIKDSSLLDLERALNLSLQGIDVFDSESWLFNDICTNYSINETDVLIKDRQNDIYVNVSLCENNCVYKGIDYETKTVKCDCTAKQIISLTWEINPDITTQFYNPLISSNFLIVKCYHYFYTWKYIKKNIGFWLNGVLVLIVFILTWNILFMGIKKISDNLFILPMCPPHKIHSILKKKENPKLKEGESKDCNHHKSDIKKLKVRISNDSCSSTRFDRNSSSTRLNVNMSSNVLRWSGPLSSLNMVTIPEKKKRKEYFPRLIEMDTEDIRNNHNNHNNTEEENKDSKIKAKRFKFTIRKIKSENAIRVNNVFTAPNDNDNEFKIKRSMTNSKRRKREYDVREWDCIEPDIVRSKSYIYSKKNTRKKPKREIEIEKVHKDQDKDKVKDKNNEDNSSNEEEKYGDDSNKTYCGRVWTIFIEVFKSTQTLPRICYHKSKFELVQIKALIYLFSLITTFSINAIFYTDDVISERYQNQGKMNILSSVLKSLYSNLICLIITAIANSFTNYILILDNFILEAKTKDLLFTFGKIYMRGVKKRLIFLIILINILNLFFWYYITIFCGIFQKSQFAWFKSGIISFILSLCTSFGICFALSMIKSISITYNFMYLKKFVGYMENKI